MTAFVSAGGYCLHFSSVHTKPHCLWRLMCINCPCLSTIMKRRLYSCIYSYEAWKIPVSVLWSVKKVRIPVSIIMKRGKFLYRQLWKVKDSCIHSYEAWTIPVSILWSVKRVRIPVSIIMKLGKFLHHSYEASTSHISTTSQHCLKLCILSL